MGSDGQPGQKSAAQLERRNREAFEQLAAAITFVDPADRFELERWLGKAEAFHSMAEGHRKAAVAATRVAGSEGEQYEKLLMTLAWAAEERASVLLVQVSEKLEHLVHHVARREDPGDR